MNPQLPFFAFPLNLPLVSQTNLLGLNQSPFNHSLPNLLASGLTTLNTAPFYFDAGCSDGMNVMNFKQSDPVFETTKKQKLNTSETMYSLFNNSLDLENINRPEVRTIPSQRGEPELIEDDDDCVIIGSLSKNQNADLNCLNNNQSPDLLNQETLLSLLTQQSLSNHQVNTANLLSVLLQNTAPLDLSMCAKGNDMYNPWNQIEFNSIVAQPVNQEQANQISCLSTQTNSLVVSRGNSTSGKARKEQEAILIDDEPTCETRFEEASFLDAELKINKRGKSSKIRMNLALNLNKEQDKMNQSALDHTFKPTLNDQQFKSIAPIESIDTGDSSAKELNQSKLTTEYAVIPAFEMFGSPISGSRRNIKRVWTPCSIGLENYEFYHKKIEETVGMEITNQEKVIKTLQEYNMNLKDACESLRRNKANSKHFFKVQKKPRDRVLKS